MYFLYKQIFWWEFLLLSCPSERKSKEDISTCICGLWANTPTLTVIQILTCPLLPAPRSPFLQKVWLFWESPAHNLFSFYKKKNTGFYRALTPGYTASLCNVWRSDNAPPPAAARNWLAKERWGWWWTLSLLYGYGKDSDPHILQNQVLALLLLANWTRL